MAPCHITTPVVAAADSAARTSPGVAFGWPSRYSAATPALWGADIEVPVISTLSLSPPFPADTMDTPGAYQSTHAPQFEKYGLVSVRSVAPVVIASATRAGE